MRLLSLIIFSLILGFGHAQTVFEYQKIDLDSFQEKLKNDLSYSSQIISGRKVALDEFIAKLASKKEVVFKETLQRYNQICYSPEGLNQEVKSTREKLAEIDSVMGLVLAMQVDLELEIVASTKWLLREVLEEYKLDYQIILLNEPSIIFGKNQLKEVKKSQTPKYPTLLMRAITELENTLRIRLEAEYLFVLKFLESET